MVPETISKKSACPLGTRLGATVRSEVWQILYWLVVRWGSQAPRCLVRGDLSVLPRRMVLEAGMPILTKSSIEMVFI